MSNGFNDFFNFTKIIVDLFGTNLSALNLNFVNSTYMTEFKKNKPIPIKKTFENIIMNPNINDIFEKIDINILIIHPKCDELVPYKNVIKLFAIFEMFTLDKHKLIIDNFMKRAVRINLKLIQ